MRIGMLTGGGDCPGLNAVMRAITRKGVNTFGDEMVGFEDGWRGVMEGKLRPLDIESFRGTLPRGGTVLGSSRTNPSKTDDGVDRCIATLEREGIDALVAIGGDDTLGVGAMMAERGVAVVGVPKTIDNDLSATELTFGFDTAVSIATEAIDRLHTTAESHHRVMVLEVMGRDAGFIALHAGLAGGADVILIPEIPFTRSAVCRKVTERIRNQAFFSIIVVAEGAHEAGGEKIYTRSGDEIAQARLGGMGAYVADFVAQSCQVETRVTVLGHLQRGGSPSAFDRVLATRFGAAAVRAAAEGKFGHMVTLQCGRITTVPLAEALAVPKRVDVYGDAIQTARDLTICLGDG